MTRGERDGARDGESAHDDAADRSRRAFLATIATAVGSAVVLTAGQSFGWLEGGNLFAPRVRGLGPQSVPVNRTARAAGVVESASDSGWTLTIANGSGRRDLGRAELLALPQTEAVLPIACVEGWSTSAHWRGVRLRELMDLVGAPEGSGMRATSLEPHGGYRVMIMEPEFVRDPRTLVALSLNGETLDLDHGFPARIIAPGRPGVLQTKWLSRLEAIR